MALIIRYATYLPSMARGAVVALGNFDGVHLGHQAVISTAKQLAQSFGSPLAVMTFEPHPRSFFSPQIAPFRLTTLSQKIKIFEAMDVQYVFVLYFNQFLASLPAEHFIQDILHQKYEIGHIVVGENFVFGKDRTGDTSLLRKLGSQLNFKVTSIPSQQNTKGQIISSSYIRSLLQSQKPQEAAHLLGRAWAITGHVRHGQQRGRTIGVPTANISLSSYLHPAFGVYAVRVLLKNGARYSGIANIGMRPTVGGTQVLLETHLFDMNMDLYGQRLEVQLLTFLRPERKFENLDILKNQILEDIRIAKQFFQTKEPSDETILPPIKSM